MNKQYRCNNFDDAYIKVCKDLLENPDFVISNRNDHGLRELVNPTIIISNPLACLALSRDLSLKYLKGELEFYLSGSPYLKDIVRYSKFWNGVSDDGYTITSNYGRLLLHDRNSHNLTQFEYARRCLEKNIDSKKAVMVVYNKEHARTTNDNPCTMYLQFMVREGKVLLFVKMRSSDVWFGMPYDIPFFVYLQKMMADSLGLKIGQYVHNSGSLHMYDRNIEGVTEVSKKEPALASIQTEKYLQVLREV